MCIRDRSWRAFGRAAALLAGVAVARREGDDLAAIRRQAAYLTDKYGLHIYLLEESVAAVSSTQVRRLAARDQRLEGLVCPAVAQYIRRHRLYRDPMLEELRRTMTPRRYRHTLGVEQTALSLAARYGVDQDKACLLYTSMSPKKSKWSWVKLVNPTTWKKMPSTRRMAMAWADTSITTYSMPSSTIRRSSRCISTGSGVVSWAGIRSSPTMDPTVPMRPVLCPAPSSTDLMRKDTVVLPLSLIHI